MTKRMTVAKTKTMTRRFRATPPICEEAIFVVEVIMFNLVPFHHLVLMLQICLLLVNVVNMVRF